MLLIANSKSSSALYGALNCVIMNFCVHQECITINKQNLWPKKKKKRNESFARYVENKRNEISIGWQVTRERKMKDHNGKPRGHDLSTHNIHNHYLSGPICCTLLRKEILSRSPPCVKSWNHDFVSKVLFSIPTLKAIITSVRENKRMNT